MPEEAIGQFFSRAWEVYEKVVAADYLSHRLLYAGVRRSLEAQNEIRFLELGCGDASASRNLLRDLKVLAYLGLDSSQGALELARSRVPDWRFLEADVRRLPDVGADWTVAFASFCLHHLSPDEKRDTLRQIASACPLFLMIDLCRQEGQSREHYLERRRAWMRAEWKALSPEELEVVMEHEAAADFPETVSDYHQWGLEAGFTRVQEELAAPDGMHRWLTFSK